MRAWLPAALLCLFTFWCGTFHDGAGATAGLVAYALLLFLAATNRRWLDPLALGPRGGGLIAALLLMTLLSLLVSPVPRAGRTAFLLLPAFFLLPGALAAAWRSESARRRGLLSLSWVVLGVSLWALADRFLAGSPRAAMPLGHHNLLAVWLVTLLPLATLGARYPGPGRWAAIAAAGTGTATLVATGSLAGTAALALEVSVALILLGAFSKRKGWLLGGGLFLVLAFLPVVPRLGDLLAGEDASWAARRAYLEAGWEGIRTRPGTGWGPGATPWVVSEFLKPVPGIHPPGNLVGDLHNLPLQLSFELGVPAAALCLLLFLLLLLRRAPTAKDPPMRGAAKLGALGFAVASLGGASLSVLALPVALATVIGAGLAAGASISLRRSREQLRGIGRWVPSGYAVVAAFFLAPALGAHFAFEGAAKAEDPLPGVERALSWDPQFPLYRARYALLADEPGEALAAAEDGVGIAAHWFLAASMAGDSGASWGESAALRACRLDPFNALPPYVSASLLRSSGGSAKDAAEAMARALLAEPRLLAAPAIYLDASFRERVVERILRQGGVEEGVRARWAELNRELESLFRPRAPGTSAPALATLVQGYDGRPEAALSTFLFRRRPWLLTLYSVGLNPELVSTIDLPPATQLRSTAPWVFSDSGCGLGELGGMRSQDLQELLE